VDGFNITLVVTAGQADCTAQASFVTAVRVLEKPCLLKPRCNDDKKTGRRPAPRVEPCLPAVDMAGGFH
jgi:hypothetical protein